MAQPSYMGGLLGAAQTPFNPTLPQGLLARMALPGQPAAAMAGNLMQMEGGASAPTAAAPAPAAPIAPPQPAASPTQLGLMTGGMAAMEAARPGNGGGSLGAALGAGLAAGSANFTAAKNEKADLETRRAKQEAFASAVAQLDLPDHVKTGVINLGPEAGAKLLADYKIPLPEFATNVVETGGRKAVVATNKATGVSTESYVGEAAPDKGYEPDANLQTIMTALHPGKTLKDLDEQERRRVLADAADYRRSGATNVSTTTNMGTEKLVDTLMANRANRLDADKVIVRQSVEANAFVNEALKALEGPTYAGAGAEVKLVGNKLIKDWLGIELGKDKRANTEILMAALDNVVIPQVKQLGTNPSTADLEAIRRSVGNAKTSVEALKIIARWQQTRNAGRITAYNHDVRNLRKDLEARGQTPGSDLEEFPEPGASTGPSNGATRMHTLPNGRTEKQVYDGGEWGRVVDGKFQPYRGQ